MFDVHPQKGQLIPLLRPVLILQPVLPALFQHSLFKETRYLCFPYPPHIVLFLRHHQIIYAAFRHGFQAFSLKQLLNPLVRRVYHMIAARGKVHLSHRGIHIPQHGKILHLFQLQGAQAAVPHPQDTAVMGKLCRRGDIAVPVPFAQVSQLRLHILKAVQQPGGKASAFTVQNHVEGLFMGNRLLINTVRREGIVCIHNGHGLGADRDGISVQPIRISPAVPALMMVPADVVGVLEIPLIAHTFQALQNLASPECMGLHDFKLFYSEAARFIKYLIFNGNLADIVKGRGRSNDFNLFLIQPVFRTISAHLLQKHLGQQTDALDMLPRLQTPVFNDR